ncbi:ribosomal L34 mitochondrial [Fusarium albosuccineum]|uniref:Ribosomal L34 mitochondrial n=1 Tax=Fusarium albosuccineum TaxID=1237068 RepID=A0A8H4PGI9_9HYPO|nr:ribosomal L34 mitochondrial [Fusarium albosuccineum]
MFSSITRLVRPVLTKPLAQSPRTFTTLVPLRPSLTPSTGAIRRTVLPSSFTPSTAASADLVPASAISAHPALGDLQIRCGPRNTMNGHTRLIQKRRHGFLYRTRSRTGRKILWRRKVKGRKNIAQ